MTRMLLAVCTALAVTLCFSAASHAHKVNIFAYVDGDTVITESGYSRSQRVNGGTVEVRDLVTGELLLSGVTDEQGRFRFVIPDKARQNGIDLELVLKAGVGHQGTWVIKAEEYMHGTPGGAESANDIKTPPRELETGMLAPPTDSAVVESAVELVVKRELEPVKRMLAELNQPGPSMSDILGGIGYIFGFFGIAAYFMSRK